jgi:ERCC4-related helicase
MTEYHASYFAHELSRRHSLNDSEKLATALADAQVDLNPHQLDAALFAFRSPLSKGSILADEVGLGKTIEAGLVISQKWAEKKRRILIITPANLRKQWAMEMKEKFYLPALILETNNYNQLIIDGDRNPFVQDGLIICSYQFAAKNYDKILLVPWELAVIDESHRLRNVYKTENKIAKAIKKALLNTPKILLTATPLQNSLMELYGLVSIIDDYAFGDEKSFKSQYARLTGESVFDELKARLAPLCHRTLRRQVLEYIRYTNRIPLTEDFFPKDDEMALYDMVTEYLQRDALYALPNSQRQLITLILRKLLASSTFAIAGALNTLANRLKKILSETKFTGGIEEIQNDFEEYEVESEEWEEKEDEAQTLSFDDKVAIESEIKELEFFRDTAVGITENSKGNALISALSHGFSKAIELGSAEKAIVFTESRKTQNYLINLLSENGYRDKIVLFNGTNSDPQSKAIYAQWFEKYKGTDRVSGSKTADMRTALVDQFRDTAQIMIATEAGAEGINLQFCSMVVNYDLPWNPQRIEQRIGRCHRYGQKHDVVVINFINRKNAADQRVFELLDQKFRLFSGVFGASDEVLGVIESGVDFEKRIASIYQNCRTTSDIELEFNRLQQEMESQITATMSDTRKKLLENFDADVHDRLRVNLHESREYLNKYDTMLWNLTSFALAQKAVFNQEDLSFALNQAESDVIPAGNYTLSRGEVSAHRYRIGHPLAQKLIAECKNRSLTGGHVQFDYSSWNQKSDSVAALLGQSGQLTLFLLAINGADEQDHLILSAISDRGELVPPDTARRLFDLPARVIDTRDQTPSVALNNATEKRKNEIVSELTTHQANWFEEEIEKLNFWAEDKRKGLKSELKDYDEQIAVLKKEARLAANLPDKLAIQKQLRDLDHKRDEAWKAYDADAKTIENQKDELLDTVEERLKQTIEGKTIFTIHWSVV